MLRIRGVMLFAGLVLVGMTVGAEGDRLLASPLLPEPKPARIAALEVATARGDHLAPKPAAAESAHKTSAIKTPDRTNADPADISAPAKQPAAPSAGTKTAAATATGTLPPAKPKGVAKTLQIHVNLSTQTMRVMVNGVERHVWKVSTGRGRYRTPNGVYRPQWTKRMHYSRQWNNSPMPYSVFFYRGYAVHGTNYVRSLGRPASHGCVRLATANARTLYNLVRRHGKAATQIRVTGKTPYVPTRRVASYVKRNKARAQRRARRAKKTFWPFDL